MFKKLCVASMLALPAAVMADGLSYTYAEASYVAPEEGDGFRVGASFALNPQFFFQAEGTFYDFGGNADGTVASGVLGYRHALTPTIDLTANGGLLYAEYEAGSSSSDDVGYTFGGGVRAKVLSQLELNGGVSYQDVFDNGDLVLALGAVYSFTPSWAGIAGGKFVDNDDQFNIGVRYNF